MRAQDTLTNYLSHINATHATGQANPEVSYYPALANLIDAVGATMKPRVHCVINPKNQGAGIPDGGLFTHDQLASQPVNSDWPSLNPARGAVEVKSPSDEVDAIAQSPQVKRYAEKYGQVLVTNLRAFLPVVQRPDGQITLGERFQLAPDDSRFWDVAAFPRTLPEGEADRFVQYLERVLRYNAPLNTPADVAWYLASYAREASARVERAGLAGLSTIRTALESALGLHFTSERGAHFFRSTLVQTLFYGIFSAWVLWAKKASSKDQDFDWRDAAWSLHVPAIRVLFEQVATRTHLEPLHLVDVLDWAGDALNRVNREQFFARFAEEHAVQYFYEPFLEAFDPELRKQLGVWYTPPEVVEYMVSRVDTVLREELGRPDGLADLKRTAMERIFGFEILPAPFVVAHLQIGLLLQNLGAPLAGDKERAGVYLTNALTGWESGERQTSLPWPELQQERDAAGKVKIGRKVLVVIGNPPYNGYAGVAVEEERDLSNAYRVAKTTRQPQGQGLNDLYVRFFRMAERRIVEMTGEGVVCFISNYSWLDGLSFTAMRERYLETFDRIWIDCLNGDKYKTGKVTPEGEPDPSVFSTERNREGIQVGTAVALMSRAQRHTPAETVHFRHIRGKTKRQQLLDTAEQHDDRLYEPVTPETGLGLPFFPMASQADYLSWPLLPDLFPVSFPGVKTSRDDVVVDVDRDRLIARMEKYFDPMVSHEQMRRIAPGAMEDAHKFDGRATRDKLRMRGFLPDYVVQHAYRPFDDRWLYWEPETSLLDRKREEYVPQVFDGNAWLACAQRTRKDFDSPLVTSHLASLHVIERGANLFPLLRQSAPALALSAQVDQPRPPESEPNLSKTGMRYLAELDAKDQFESLFFHAIAVLHAPAYQAENAGALRQDWPRIPLPTSKDRLVISAGLGRLIASIMDLNQLMPRAITSQSPRVLASIGGATRVGGGALDPTTDDTAVTAGWGFFGHRGAVMAGKGRAVEREYGPEEFAAITAWQNPLGLPLADAFALLGETTFDIYLNDRAYWRNVPRRVWEYTMGGYQVLKKWLSYREREVLGRPLSLDEARLFQQIARRIAALLLLEPQLDANYRAVKEATYPWAANTPVAASTLTLWETE
ncbi:MAG: type ISP restriction/modification enzyme [Thermomicrobiales bacterium]